MYHHFVRRIQIHLDEELDEALARDAHERGISKAALIREYLARHVTTRRGTGDAGDRLIGAYDGARDESERIDDLLYGR